MMRDTMLEAVGTHPKTINEFYRAVIANCKEKNSKEYDSELEAWFHNDKSILDKTHEVDSTQSMIYAEGDIGPFRLSRKERLEQKYGRPTGEMITVKKKVSELQEELEAMGIKSKGKRERLVELANAASISLHRTEGKVIAGWLGKPKGLLQVLFERGLIDPTKFDPRHSPSKQWYTVSGRKDQFDNLIERSSLRWLMETQPDFDNEETLLQHHARLLGADVDHSPKAHPECAGEGVEYAWGFSKLVYRRAPLVSKKKKEKFRLLVKQCISRETVTIDHVRRFARRARSYIIAYLALSNVKKNGSLVEGSTEEGDALEGHPKMSVSLIEKIVKIYKTHRNIVDQELAFIKSVIDEMR